MKRPVPHPSAAASLASPPAIGSDATDAALLAALDAPAFLHSAQSRAHAAYQAARVRSDNPTAPGDWQMLDGRWQDMMRELNAARRTVESQNAPNTAAGQAGRVAEVRALLSAAEWFEAYAPPKAPKPGAGTFGLTFAQSGQGEHWLEKLDREAREGEMATMQEGTQS